MLDCQRVFQRQLWEKTHQQFSTHETESLSFPIDGDHHVLVLQGLVNVLCFLILNITLKYISGWWFGTWLYFSIYWECHHPNWRTHIFQRGRSTTNQISVRDSMPFFVGWGEEIGPSPSITCSLFCSKDGSKRNGQTLGFCRLFVGTVPVNKWVVLPKLQGLYPCGVSENKVAP